MAVFKKKKNVEELSDYAKQQEDRAPNHWTYNDDPLLNMEPVFTDGKDGPAPSIEEVAKQYMPQSENKQNDEVAEKLQAMRKNIGIPKEPKVGGVLGSIINGARQKSSSLQNEILENDPVIAKLHKIEQLKRSGGVDADLYTDLTKSKTESYAQRAKKFHSENITKKIVETELERKLRLSREAQERRESLRASYTPQIVEEQEEVKEENIFLAQKKSVSRLQELEDKVKGKILDLKNIMSEKLEKETELSILTIETETFETDKQREEFLEKKLKEFETYIEKSQKKIANKSDDVATLVPRKRKTTPKVKPVEGEEKIIKPRRKTSTTKKD
ncbi:hypothetical protein SCHIN_v1c10400 [Spiroplasma chinense]|uniref:Uncharacterized protein n=1 Tax=Spiroplasma chinense TaxID=216932 RepID=A0A5B9Y607_9MOLU|nr:hypothetical protein [Spiroplasma chinense]QEH62233.1 hypothetical protein SCHIN_v1c10400 [Spiroplasma chinense]